MKQTSQVWITYNWKLPFWPLGVITNMTYLDNFENTKRIDLEQGFLNLSIHVTWGWKLFAGGTVLCFVGCLAGYWLQSLSASNTSHS